MGLTREQDACLAAMTDAKDDLVRTVREVAPEVRKDLSKGFVMIPATSWAQVEEAMKTCDEASGHALAIFSESFKQERERERAIRKAIDDQAAESVKLLREQGWTSDGKSYRLSVFAGDIDSLAARLGRKPDINEECELEAAIRKGLSS